MKLAVLKETAKDEARVAATVAYQGPSMVPTGDGAATIDFDPNGGLIKGVQPATATVISRAAHSTPVS